MPGTNTLVVVTKFTCYRTPALDAKPPSSGPKTTFEVGVTIDDATEDEAGSWLAAGLVERAKPGNGAPTEMPSQPDA